MTELKSIELPDTLYELLRVSLGHLKTISTDMARYEIDMDDGWHEVILPGGVCSVCLAGAVMAQVCAPEEFALPEHFDRATHRKLITLDLLRKGKVDSACNYPYPSPIPNRKITPYGKSPSQWWKDMYQLQSDLKEAGI